MFIKSTLRGYHLYIPIKERITLLKCSDPVRVLTTNAISKPSAYRIEASCKLYPYTFGIFDYMHLIKDCILYIDQLWLRDVSMLSKIAELDLEAQNVYIVLASDLYLHRLRNCGHIDECPIETYYEKQ